MAWPVSGGNVTKTVSELSKASEEWLVPNLCEVIDVTIGTYCV
jgi:hypothetical protein